MRVMARTSGLMMRIARAKRTALGRTLCRLFGDRTGGVMMEYVLLGVLVAAAVVALVWAFGGTLSGGLRTMTMSIFHPQKAGDTFTAEAKTSDDDVKKADAQNKQFDVK